MTQDHGAVERRAIAAVITLAVDGSLPPAARWLGLGPAEYARLNHLTDIDDDLDAPPPDLVAPPIMLIPLLEMLWAFRANDEPLTRLVAGTIACACFGSRHLWQDLGLSGRQDVSGLLSRHFPALARGNTQALRWKHYLFLRLGDEQGLQDLRPPHCEQCEDFASCFPAPAR